MTSHPSLEIPVLWFRRVRLAMWGCQLALLLWARVGLEVRLPTAWLTVFVGVGFGLDLVIWRWQRRGVTENQLTALMLVDTALHSLVFASSGGPFNPFTVLNLVNVVLAALVLSRARQWIIYGATLLGFAALFLVERVAPPDWQLPDHRELMRLHLAGMWWAFVIAAGFIVYFVQRLLGSLSQQSAALEETRRRAAQHEKLAALTTLAAGAAHELATPLATIAVASHEMARVLQALDVPPSLRDDAVLVRQEVERCRKILQGMSLRSGELVGEASARMEVKAWLEDALQGVERARIRGPETISGHIVGPPTALAQALRNLVRNALEASTGQVQIEVHQHRGTVEVAIADDGQGIDPAVLARAGEPFFTTKPVGQGMGLGVFLARSLASQLGGSVQLLARPQGGVCARFSLPEAAS